jgi:RNA polymerase-associated protein CTR9
VQFADILTLLASGHINLGCIAQAEGSVGEAILHFNAALKSSQKNSLAAIGLAQMQFKNSTFRLFVLLSLQRFEPSPPLDEVAAAIHTLDTLINPPNPQRPIEAIVLLASLRAFPRPGVTASDAALEKSKARELYDQVLKTIEGVHTDEYTQRKAIVNFGDDVDMFVEIARLWQEDDPAKMRKALQEAVRASHEVGKPDPRLLNNMGVMTHLEGNSGDARAMYEAALTDAASQASANADGISTTILYNLARVYENQGDTEMAREAYEKLLTRHPEYVDGACSCCSGCRHVFILIFYLSENPPGAITRRS